MIRLSPYTAWFCSIPYSHVVHYTMFQFYGVEHNKDQQVILASVLTSTTAAKIVLGRNTTVFILGELGGSRRGPLMCRLDVHWQ